MKGGVWLGKYPRIRVRGYVETALSPKVVWEELLAQEQEQENFKGCTYGDLQIALDADDLSVKACLAILMMKRKVRPAAIFLRTNRNKVPIVVWLPVHVQPRRRSAADVRRRRNEAAKETELVKRQEKQLAEAPLPKRRKSNVRVSLRRGGEKT